MLKLKNELLDPNFEGYKVSMQNIPIFKQKFEEKCFLRNRPNSMVSLAHLKIFGQENSIFSNSAKNGCVYRFLENGDVQLIEFDDKLSTFSTSTITNIALQSPETIGYPPKILFTSHNLIVVSNGISDIWVFLEIAKNQWVEMLKFEVLSEIDAGIHLIEARVDENRENLHILACRVEKNGEKMMRNRIFWITVGLEDLDLAETLKIKQNREIIQNGNFETCTLDENLEKLVIFAAEPPKFSEKCEKLGEFRENGRNIEVEFEIFDDVQEENVKFNISKKSIFLAINDEILIDGSLFGEINEKNVEICADPKNHKILVKIEKVSDEMWNRLLEAGNAEIREKIEKKGLGLSKNAEISSSSSEYAEECDENSEFEQLSIFYLDFANQKICAKIDISGHQLIFTRRNNIDPMEMCLRHDVDGIIWQLRGGTAEHAATLRAFGYVQASKMARLWSGAAHGNGEFAVIFEANRLLIYWQNVQIDGELMNRKKCAKIEHIAKQNILRIDSSQRICGFAIDARRCVYAATNDEIHVAVLHE